ncbi:hypothetical protein SNOG_10313 [Parastagonospora nodorum SN15]|uniref:Uncharacterized protein n=1 Tax=Phaeosphaeria nodorum (strain SN15 / ATCC MYA-4574 / FGSC 10173) TaxID=321614 RepID=Q0UD51_PHANO|nr:hypothetical protein SNOG_10313 [Parastagonospora nodorum SN15]EAT82648.1 hypothetical protein SNOG_10313 [Parastagonospora nodorum SN15]
MLCNTARRLDSGPRASLCSFLFRKEGCTVRDAERTPVLASPQVLVWVISAPLKDAVPGMLVSRRSKRLRLGPWHQRFGQGAGSHGAAQLPPKRPSKPLPFLL